MDIESFPELEAWAVVGYKSANFARQKKAGETDSAATRRIAELGDGLLGVGKILIGPAIDFRLSSRPAGLANYFGRGRFSLWGYSGGHDIARVR